MKAKARRLHISGDFTLPIDFVTGTQAILATKGRGKSHVAQVEAEELLEVGQVVVVIDPTDAWYGLRSSADGKHPGYPIAVFGGDHGDIQLDPGAGSVLAEAIVAERFSCVICTEGLSESGEIRFVADFLRTLYRKNREPLHLFVDEADMFAAQKPFNPDEAKALGAMQNVVRRGRKKGIGCTMISQRPSVVNKDVLSQIDMLIVLGMSHPLDLEAVEKWVRRKKTAAITNAMMDELPEARIGDAWAWSPSTGLHKKFRAREKRTFDSGATPKAGKRAREPKILAPVDIARLGATMAETVQRQRDNDPTALKAELARMRKANADLVAAAERNAKRPIPVANSAPKIVDGKVGIDRKELRRIALDIHRAVDLQISQLTNDVRSHLVETRRRVSEAVSTSLEGVAARSLPVDPKANAIAERFMKRTEKPTTKRILAPASNGQSSAKANHVDGLSPAHLRILTSIAWWEGIGIQAPDLAGVAFIAKASSKSSAFNNNRSKLRTAGYIEYPSSGCVQLTDAGRDIAPPVTVPLTNEALHQVVLSEVTPAHRRMLVAVIEAYPKDLAIEEFAERSGASPTSSAFNNNRSWLRSRGLVQYPRTGFVCAASLLFPQDR